MFVDILLFVANLFNFLFWIGFPMYRRFQVLWAARFNMDKVVFRLVTYSYFAGDDNLEPDVKIRSFVECRLPVNSTQWFQWNMTHEGELINNRHPGHLGYFQHEPGELLEEFFTGPRTPEGKIPHRMKSGRRLAKIRMYGLFAWWFKKYVAEQFVMAKLVNFELPS